MTCSAAIGPVFLLCLGVAPGTPPDDVGAADPDAAYRAATRAAGRDADAQVRLALWCEAQGRHADALRHLALAVLVAPDHPTARGLLGQVRRGQAWARPEPQGGADAGPTTALREEYEGRRARLEESAEDHWKLALWCERSGLADEAAAHFAAVTRLDPGREAAWRRLGYRRVGGRWATDAQAEAARAEAKARSEATERWLPVLTAWRGMLDATDADRRAEAERQLASVDDPRAVPAVWRVFAPAGQEGQLRAAQILGQIDAPEASQGLAMLAVSSTGAEVRRRATEALRRRDPREWAAPLVAAIREPIKYEVRPVGGPGSPGGLFVEGEEFSTRRIYEVRGALNFRPPRPDELFTVNERGVASTYVPWIDFPQGNPDASALAAQLRANPQDAANILRQQAPAAVQPSQLAPLLAMSGGPIIPIASDPFAGWLVTGTPRVDRELTSYLELRQATASAQERLQADVAFIESTNAGYAATNAKVLPVLQQAVGIDFGVDRESWEDWYNDQIGFQADRRQGSAQRRVVTETLTFGRVSTSCFAAGTPVWTDRGLRPIEALAVGDRVLAQDPDSGALAYRPVTATHQNPPSKTFAVRAGGETIVSSAFHRFWVAGRGWVMARDLRVGDPLRALGRTAAVEAIEEHGEQPVYNLDVADHRNFFVGQIGALVHDLSLPSPTFEPFDAVPDLAAIGEGAEAPTVE